jgi:hypothetical protein
LQRFSLRSPLFLRNAEERKPPYRLRHACGLEFCFKCFRRADQRQCAAPFDHPFGEPYPLPFGRRLRRGGKPDFNRFSSAPAPDSRSFPQKSRFFANSKKIGKKIKPNKIVFHNTANTAPAINEIKWLNSKDNTSTTSFHFAVDESGVYQAVPTNYATYHAGDFSINNSSIGIEIAKSKLDNIEEKNNGIKNATLLIVLLMNYYDIDIENVITHYDSSGKYCPHDIFDRYGLENFYNDIKELV